jgi:ribosome biogenesis protein UTP30
VIRSIKIGILSQKPDQILANLELALPAIAKNIQGGWDNIQAFHIKTNSSTSLPIWSCSLDEKEGGRWDGLNAMTDDAGETSAEEDDDDAKVEHDEGETQKEAVQSAGKKRAQSDDRSEKPRKKAKGAQDKIVSSAVTISKPFTATSTSPSKPDKPASYVIDIPPKSAKRKSVEFDHMSSTTDLPAARSSVDPADATDSLSTQRVRKPAKSTNAHTRTHETNAKLESGQPSKEKKERRRDNDRQDTSSSVPASK